MAAVPVRVRSIAGIIPLVGGDHHRRRHFQRAQEFDERVGALIAARQAGATRVAAQGLIEDGPASTTW